MIRLELQTTNGFAEPASPGPKPGPTVVSHLQQSDFFREYQQAFEATTGLPLVLREAGSFRTPLQGSTRINPFCALMTQSNETCAACLQLQQALEQKAVKGARTMKCFAGLHESAVPIRVGNKVLAYLQTGQVFLQPPTPARFRSLCRVLAQRGFCVELPQLKAAYFQTRVMSRPQYDSAVILLGLFAQHLAVWSNRVMVQGAAVDDPVIARARSYIAAHQSEPMTLRTVAQAAHRSAWYFCKTFKQATGLRFRDYLARMRVEAVKQMLLIPHKRVSEAAFAAGFQSLSQFNRTFRRIEGKSPMAWREKSQPLTAA